jgi:hypothetical protein
MKNSLIRVALGAAFLATLTVPVGIATASPDDGAVCSQKLESARAQIDRDAAKHGNDSRQVDKDRERLEQARQWCRDHKSDWDHTKFDVGIYIKK